MRINSGEEWGPVKRSHRNIHSETNEARERELQEAWGGQGLGNSIKPRLSKLEREKLQLTFHSSTLSEQPDSHGRRQWAEGQDGLFSHFVGSQLETNKKALNIQCKVCMQTFISEVKCREHAEAKHPKADLYTCFPHLHK
ncbi:hypothetical protein D0Y65_028158 [Glycine soja]|uniref:C2H2-type domain-containing protein n=1 Tax=Glycine soja TaxID=3848 RepID=A0A445IST4_GLYSO|nr:hypothetical protein D0Y65_028158 [Glycine soja]